MKKLILLTFTVISISGIIPCKAYAYDITVGAATWYTWWDINSENGDTRSLGPSFLYGPAISLKFNDDFNLTFIYLYGKFDDNEAVNVSYKRVDSDLALNYRLNDYFKVFAGIKYMGFSKPGSIHAGYGPGLGVSFTSPITNPIIDNLFLLATLSGLYTWGDEEDRFGDKSDYNEYGLNSNLSVAYYITPASTTVTLGGRFQYFKTDYDDGAINKHFFYGITLAATYTFSL